MPLVEGLCHVLDFDQMWSKKCAPCWRTLSRLGLQPNVVQKKVCPSSKDFVTSWTLTKYGPKMCPSSENFVMSRTLTKCGQKMCPSSEDFVTSRTFTNCGPKLCPSLGPWVVSTWILYPEDLSPFYVVSLPRGLCFNVWTSS